LNGSIPPESWNRIGTRLIPKLRSTAQPNLCVSFSVEIDAADAANLMRDIQQVLADLDLSERIRIEFK
jgi:hypothetical protein